MPDQGALSATDADLLAGAAAGDAAAFERFLDRHQAPAWRLARASSSSEADAEDALQEALVAAWRAAGTFRGEGSARAWFLTITRHAAFRLHRRHVGEPDALVPLLELGAEAGWGSTLGDAAFAQRLTDRLALEEAFGALAPEEREVLVLRDLEGFSAEEAASALELSVAALKSRLHRARLRLAAQLKKGGCR